MNQLKVELDTPRVIFNDDDHSYWMGDKRLTSVSSNLSKYENPYDKEYWLDHVAFKELIPDYMNIKRKMSKSMKPDLTPFYGMVDPVDFKVTRARTDAKWSCERDRASIMGTMFHNQQEEISNIRGGSINPHDNEFVPMAKFNRIEKYDNHSLLDDLYQLPDGFYPELLVWDDNYAGQADLVYITTLDDGQREVQISDFKTNKKKPYKSSGIDMMLEPLSHLRQNKYFRYSLQISAYAHLLEKVGFVIGQLSFIWVKKYDIKKTELMEVPYMKEEIELIF